MSKKRLLRLVGTVVLLGVLITLLDLRKLSEVFLSLDWRWWMAAVGCYVVAQLISTIRWRSLAAPLGIRAPWTRYAQLYFVGVFFNQLLPTSLGGDVVRAWNLTNDKQQRVAAFLSVFADRLSGLAMLVAMACVAALLVELPRWVQWWIIALASGMGVGLVVVIYLACASADGTWSVPATLPSFAPQSSFPSAGLGTPPREAPASRADGTWSVPATMKKLLHAYRGRVGLAAAVALLALIIQALNVIIVWLLTWAVGISIPLSFCFVMVPLVTLLTLVPVSVGGLGAREGGMILFLSPLGFSPEQAVTLALLWLSVFSAVGLLGGGFYLFGSFSKHEVQSNDGSVDRDSDQGRARQSGAAA